MAEWDSPRVEQEGMLNANTENFSTQAAGLAKGNDVDGSVAAAGDTSGETCRFCKEVGHVARECPQAPAGSSGCFNCGQDGHNKADCPNPKVMSGTCRVCDKEGHFAADCPNKPADVCKNCKKEGHKVTECKEARAIDRSSVAIMAPEEAWNALVAADKSRDMDDVRENIQVYVKAIPDTTWTQLEASFRKNEFNTHLIGYEKELTDTFTLMDLQGNLDRQYHVGFYWSDKPQRGTMKHVWPKDAEENFQRLHNAGIPVNRGISKCNNCEKLGHIQKNCPEDRIVRSDVVTVRCVNCEQEGHRARDCQQARKAVGGACRNCNQPGHKASECTEPRNAANVECKHCGQMGHFVKECPNREPETCRNCGEEGHRSKECTNEMNMAIQVCRNCDEKGHMSKTCPKPRDYSRVKCQNCEEMGHTKVRCKKPFKEASASAGFGDDATADFGGFETADFGSATGAANSYETPAASGDGGDPW